jgi:uncharacterized membrane protein YkoI
MLAIKREHFCVGNHSAAIQLQAVTMNNFMHHEKFTLGKHGLAPALAVICILIVQPAFCQIIEEPRYSLDEAVVLVKQSVGGEVLRAKKRQKNGRTVYDIRVLTDDGLVRDLLFDAENGLEE